MIHRREDIWKARLCIGAFIVGLCISGITAFPLLHEMDILCAMLRVGDAGTADAHSGLANWLAWVREGLRYNHNAYPFMAYGTDWLAFGHLTIALFFLGPLVNPVKNVWVIHAGLAACVAVIPLALICGSIRGIPLYWRFVDCSFGVIGFIPLWIARNITGRLSAREIT